MNFGERYTQAIMLIDEAYQENNEIVSIGNNTYPKEYLYALRMVDELEKFCPDADEEVFLSARCQHLYRWEIPRNTYPLDRKGYHQWRSFLYTYQSNKTEKLLQKVDYPNEFIERVKIMIEKKDLKNNPKSQLLEDVVCLVFLNYDLADFIEKHAKDVQKLKRIIKSTWLKMSPKAHETALKIPFADDVKAFVLEAVL
ncbi:DUF4202 domain-containing protein [Labilibacter sediminis]|nr:DUF4202 domain-containing protein [Labilibacter sediminis]